MKCAIFCLLAFCAFETVFADKSGDERALSNYLANDPLDVFWKKLNSDIQAAVDATKMQKIKSDDVLFKCWTGHNYPVFSGSMSIKDGTCMQCYEKYNENIKSARNCCNKLIPEIRKETKSHLDLAKKCIAKCAQSEDDCLKEIKQEKKDFNIKWNLGQYTEES